MNESMKIIVIMLIVLILMGAVFFFVFRKHNGSRSKKDLSLELISEKKDLMGVFLPVQSLTKEEENALVPITDKRVIERIADSVPKVGQVVSNAANAANMKKLADGGIYKVIIPDGASLDKSRAMEDAYRASFRQQRNRIKGDANLVPLDGTAEKAAVANAVNAAMGVASIVVGQYYMGQINSQLESVKKSISMIRWDQENEYYSKVMQLALDVQNIAEFKLEIYDNSKERERILDRLSSLESQCEQLLIRANKHLEDLINSKQSSYNDYENNTREIQKWFQYQQGLENIMNAISELRYTLNNGSLSKEYTHSKLNAMKRQTGKVKDELVEWHKQNIEKYKLDIQQQHRNRQGIDAAFWYLPGLVNDSLNYKPVDAATIKRINKQITGNGTTDSQIDDPYKQDVVIVERKGSYYYLPLLRETNEDPANNDNVN